MKKIIRTVALLVALNMTMVGCQKEPQPEPQGVTTKDNTAETVVYRVDGVQYTTTLYNDDDWDAFLDLIFAWAEEGYEVSFRGGDNDSSVSQRERIVYTTTDKYEAQRWSKTMEQNGYEVSIRYDAQTGIYTCTAIR